MTTRSPRKDADLRLVDGAVRITVRVKPRASRERVTRTNDAELDAIVAVNAPPVDGAANARVIELVAAALGIAKRDVAIVRGETARSKELAVLGLSEAEVRARLALLTPV